MLLGIDASRAVAPHPTGTEIYSRCLIRALLTLDPSLDVRLYFRSAPPDDAFPGAELRVIPFPRLWTHLRLSWEMARCPPDVLFVPAHVLPPVRPPVTLVTVHDLGYLYFPQAHPWPQRTYLDLSTRWSAHVATHILADSRATKADLISQYATPPAKISVVYPGLDESLAPVRERDVIEAVKARHGIQGDYFLYVGTLQPRKNLARLIAAFAALESDATLVLAGQRGWLYDDLWAGVRRQGLEGRVLFPGYVSAEQKAALMSGALAFLFPSLYEGFGLPVLEAQACGCPVVTSDTSSLPEVAGDAALLVDPHDTAAITAALDRLTADSPLRRDLIARGLVNLRRFSWKTSAQAVLQIVEQTV
ncbi:MAG TPA: glycosyltransferase family 1 protein [Chloroflexi bacterium]|nr:glycosyltransferase family 1 protein [Chloroflexota bacterium]